MFILLNRAFICPFDGSRIRHPSSTLSTQSTWVASYNWVTWSTLSPSLVLPLHPSLSEWRRTGKSEETWHHNTHLHEAQRWPILACCLTTKHSRCDLVQRCSKHEASIRTDSLTQSPVKTIKQVKQFKMYIISIITCEHYTIALCVPARFLT